MKCTFTVQNIGTAYNAKYGNRQREGVSWRIFNCLYSLSQVFNEIKGN